MTFQGKLKSLAEHHVANFVVQHLIGNCKSESVMTQILEELSPFFESFLFQNRSGVVAKLLETTSRFKSLQKSVVEVCFLGKSLTHKVSVIGIPCGCKRKTKGLDPNGPL